MGRPSPEVSPLSGYLETVFSGWRVEAVSDLKLFSFHSSAFVVVFRFSGGRSFYEKEVTKWQMGNPILRMNKVAMPESFIRL